VDEPAVTDGDLITASATAPVHFASAIFARLGLYTPDAAGRLAAALGEDALSGAVDTLHRLYAALDQIQRASVRTRTSGS
jgi:hypothetical protein